MAGTGATCTTCGTENREGRRFCANCGAPLQITCPMCGTANEATDRFCGNCGSELVPQEAASTPLAGSPEERRLVTVLFTDLVGFTTLSESRDHEEVRGLLSRYFDAARQIVDRYGGTIEKFIGDAVMALWGSPVAREDDAERAVRAGLDLVAAVAALGADEGLEGLAARGGVATGEASVNRTAEGEGAVIGDLVNTASRVQSEAPSGGVYVTAATKRATDEAIAFEDAGSHALKGKAEPVALFQALRVVAGRRGAIRQSGLQAPFVGRDRELRLLKDLFHGTAEVGGAHLVAITGIGGIGKSRLAWEFEKYIDGLLRDVYWHRGRCIPYGDGVAYWALAEMVRGRVGAEEEEDSASTLAKLAAWLQTWCADVEERRWLEVQLGQLLGIGDRATVPREELFSAWRRFFELLTERGPVVLVFEDLQWADTGLLDFVDDLLARASERPLYVVALARPEIAERRPGWGTGRVGWTSLALQPLRDDDMDRLLRGLVPGLPDPLVARIRERAEGVPLYAVETVRMLLDRGLLQRTDEGAELAPGADAADLDVPESLQALIGARLDGLPEEERSLLQHASVLGKSFSQSALRALTGLTPERLDPLVADLEHKELLAVATDATSPEVGQLGFLQSIVQRVVYETLSKKERKARHLAAARHLQDSWAGEDDDIAEVVAAHFIEAYENAPHDPDAAEVKAAAAGALERAGRRALSLAAHVEATGYFDRAASLVDDDVERVRLQELAARAVWIGGRDIEAIPRLDDVIADYERLGRPLDAARARSMISQALWHTDRVPDAIERMDSAYEALIGEHGREVADLAAQLGRMRFFSAKGRQDLVHALEPIDRALEIAEELADHDIVADALCTKSIILSALDRPEEGMAVLRHALELALANDATWTALRCYTNLANEMWERDDVETAYAFDVAGVELADRAGYRAPWWFMRVHFVGYFLWTGRWDRADGLFDEFLASRDDPALGQALQFVVGYLGFVDAFGRGSMRRLDPLVAEIESWDGSADFQLQANTDTTIGQLAYAAGDFVGALERAGRVLDQHEALGVRAVLFKTAAQLGLEAAIAIPDLDRVDAILESLRSVVPGNRTPFLEAMTVGFEARAAALRGDQPPEVVDAWFRDADERMGSMLAVFLQARHRLAYAEWLARIGRPEDARTQASSATETFERLGATPWLARARAIAPA